MLAHQRGDSPSLFCRGDHVAAVADMSAQTRLIGLDEVGAEDSSLRVAGYEGLRRRLYPDFPHLLLRAVRREGIGVASADGVAQHGPGARPVCGAIFPNLDHGTTATRAP